MTRDHALGLAKFVSLYKILLVLQRRMHGGKHQSSDTFFAGLVGGYLVFGNRTAINEQVSICPLLSIFMIPDLVQVKET